MFHHVMPCTTLAKCPLTLTWTYPKPVLQTFCFCHTCPCPLPALTHTLSCSESAIGDGIAKRFKNASVQLEFLGNKTGQAVKGQGQCRAVHSDNFGIPKVWIPIGTSSGMVPYRLGCLTPFSLFSVLHAKSYYFSLGDLAWGSQIQ